jgi:hypothetical protein
MKHVIPQCFAMISSLITTDLHNNVGGKWFVTVGEYQKISSYADSKMYFMYFRIGQIAFIVGRFE